MKRNNKKGFTIVELVIVIAVIAILAAVLIPTFSGIVEKANESAALQEAKGIMTEYVASIDYTETTPASTYYISVEKGGKTYNFKVDNGELDKDLVATIPTEVGTVTVTKDTDADTDTWPQVSVVEAPVVGG